MFELPAEDADLTEWESWPTHGGEFPLWPENRAVFELFTACYDQWSHAGMDGIKVGLPQPCVDAVAVRLRFKWSRERFDDLQTLKYAALQAWGQQRARDAKLKA